MIWLDLKPPSGPRSPLFLEDQIVKRHRSIDRSLSDVVMNMSYAIAIEMYSILKLFITTKLHSYGNHAVECPSQGIVTEMIKKYQENKVFS